MHFDMKRNPEDIVRASIKRPISSLSNEALRFSPATDASTGQGGGLLKKLIPGRPQFRPPSKRESAGPKQTLWVLRDGVPVAVPVTAGATDGRRTQILDGGIAAGQRVIVDAAKNAR